MKCKNCGTELSNGDLFCMNCGNAVDYSNDNKKKIIIIVVAVVVVAIITAAVLVIGITSGKKAPSGSAAVTSTVAQQETASATEQSTSSEQTTFNLVAEITTVPTTVAETTTEKKTVPQFTYDDDNAGQYLFDSANKYITKEYLAGCSRDEITIIINEIYARHGYIFKDAELRAYFNSQSWYHGTITSLEEAATHFNSIEQKNVDTIYAYQKSMGWRS
ncbi:MAG: YARHG domain-containing protein [Clostridia bacterium]|nr:YARHG domain-containing protein [Clostridia bacterium]